MKIFSNNVDDLVKIETIILACYGKEGKSVLIQPDKSVTSSFILTSDAKTILNSLEIKNNHLYYLINRLIKQYNQDGAKNLFIYLVTASRLILRPGTEFFPIQDLKVALRQLSLAKFVQKLVKQWNEILNNDENLIQLTEINDVLFYFKKMSVFFNLETFNPNLSKISQKLLCDFLDFKIKNENFIECEKSILESLDDFTQIVEYCDAWNLEDSRILKNQFLIDRKFTHCSENLANNTINSIFVLKEQNLKADIEINTDIDFVFSKLKHENLQMKFSQNFLEKLSEKKINLIFFEGFLSETKKTQLKLIGCSFIDYVSRERIDFITSRLGIDPVQSQHDNLDSSILILDWYEILKENLTTFKISKQTNLAFILFSSHLKINFINFKIYFRKCLTSLARLVSSKSEFCGVLAKSSYFEHKCMDFVAKIDFIENYNSVYLNSIKNFFHLLFQYLSLKFKRLKNFKQLIECKFSESVYDVLSLKFDCLMKCIHFLQSLVNIDSIHFVGSIKN